MKPSVRYRRDADDLREFREAFVDIINSSAPKPDEFGNLELQPAVASELWNTKRRRVSLASGPAAVAFAKFGGNMTLRNAAYVMNNVNPVINWEMAVNDAEQIPPSSVVSMVEAACANAERAYKNAVSRERGITGIIASFLRWPSALREAVDPERVGQARAAATIGYIAQALVVGVAASLIAAGIIALGASVFG